MRAYPTYGQAVRATALLAAHCEMYNAALQERRDAWRMGRVSVSYETQSAQLSTIREARPDQAQWSFTAQQQTLRRELYSSGKLLALASRAVIWHGLLQGDRNVEERKSGFSSFHAER